VGLAFSQRIKDTTALRCLILMGAILAGTSAATAADLSVSPDSVRAVHFDYSTENVRAVSPNGKFEITVTGEKISLGAWLTIEEPAQGWIVQVWPIERNVGVLWNPSSDTFAITDNRYANESFVLLIGTEFHLSGPKLGVERTDITPLLRQAFSNSARQYYLQQYKTTEYDASYAFYAKALRWTSNERLLVGVSAITSLVMSPNTFGEAPGVKGWILGYLLDMAHGRILETLSKETIREQYGIDLSNMAFQD